jgi:predicted enzyme related to lactoylglutathione lyase
MAVETTKATQTHTIVHYEIPANDAATLVKFYSNVFGWQFGTAPGMDTYHMASTTGGQDGAGVAVYPRDEGSDAKPVNYIGVESVKAFVAKIKENGGTILHEFSVEGMGHGAQALDPEGNPIGVWQSDPTAKSSWSEGA